VTTPRTSHLATGILAAALFAHPAGAVTLSTDADFTVDGVTLLDDPNSAAGGTVTSNVTSADPNVAAYDFSGPGYARAANVDGITAVDANAAYADGQNVSHVMRAEAVFADTVTNGSGSAQDFFYDFTVFGPVLELADFAGIGIGPQEIRASYLIEIRVDGSAVWSSSATLRGGDVSSTLDQSGVILNSTAIGAAPGIFGFAFDDLTTSVLLGNFAGGASFAFEALVEVSVDARGFETGGRARIGDPGDIGAAPGVSGVIRAQDGGGSPVPAPGTLLIVATGVLLLGAARRRRRTAA